METQTQMNFLTKEGFEKVKKEYEVLKQLRIAKAKNESPKMIISEDANPEYLSFYEDIGLMEIKLAKLEKILKNVILIKPPAKEKRDVVNLGATVAVKVNGQVDEFKITGSLEADPALGRISIESPVGAALFGRRAGEEITIPTPVKTTYKILNIKYLSA